jgi:hypothetical protein
MRFGVCRVALLIGTDAEATLSAEYGGTGGSNAAVDAVYVALGRVLTISGRTIKDEAQVSTPWGMKTVSATALCMHTARHVTNEQGTSSKQQRSCCPLYLAFGSKQLHRTEANAAGHAKGCTG